MSTSRGLSTTLPRSESEIVVDFARPPPTSEDDMSHDSLNEVEFCLQNLPRTSRSSSKNALYVEDSEEEEEEAKNPGTSKSFKSPKTTSKSANTLPVSSKSLKTSLEPLDTQRTTPDWNLHTQSESNTSRGSIKVVTDNRKTRLSRNLSGKTANSSPAYSFRSTIDLLPSCKKRRGLRQQVIVTFACCLGPLACGFAQAYNLSKDPGEFMAPQLGPWRTYVHLIGCLSGGFLSGFLANYGRKMVLMVIMVPMALSWFFVIFATQVWMVFLFHATSGVCTGVVMVVAQVYVAEMSVPRVRGAVCTAPLLASQVGCLMCFMLGEILVWKSLAIVGVCLVLPVFVALVLCMPESPRFLIHVHPNHALATLQWLRGLENDVMEEYHDISDSCEMDRWSIVCSDLLRPTFWRPLMISCGLMFLYTMTGLSSVMLYGMELFGEVSSVYINVAHFIVTAILIVAITLSALLVDHIGRKLLLLLSLTIMAASAFVLGLFLFLKDLHKVDSYFVYQWVAEVFCVVLFTFAHGSGVGPIAWVTLGEIFSARYKWLGVSVASMILWASMLAVDVLFHRMRIAVATGGIFWFHCVICVAGYIFVLVCFRELKEQRIDDITKSFVKKHDSLIETFIARV
ncbi:facilitated trehalose transporter Tret1-like [Cherax quadricarinatus]|uniref:facilitated trehalose transporter Tret1-like n=1 Tax=Cherax quadricarinatus TaxID=27406 RepID=UPI00387EC706